MMAANLRASSEQMTTMLEQQRQQAAVHREMEVLEVSAQLGREHHAAARIQRAFRQLQARKDLRSLAGACRGRLVSAVERAVSSAKDAAAEQHQAMMAANLPRSSPCPL